eukprot:250502-Chlamydomonas_euryale.AAC.20
MISCSGLDPQKFKHASGRDAKDAQHARHMRLAACIHTALCTTCTSQAHPYKPVHHGLCTCQWQMRQARLRID